jgi:hypothetical protein
MTDLAFVIRHRTPASCGQNALLRRFGFSSKYTVNPLWRSTDPLEEHKIGTEWLLWGVRVFDVTLSRFAQLPLLGSVDVLPLDIIRTERFHICDHLALPLFLRCLRFALVRLEGCEKSTNQNDVDV